MALTYQSSSVEVATAANPSSIAVNYPASLASGDLILMTIGTKPDTMTISPAGAWTLIVDRTGGAGTHGNDTGPCKIAMYYKVSDGTETGTESVTLGNGVATAVAWGVMIRISSGAGQYAIVGSSDVNTAGGSSWSNTADDFLDIASGDFVFAHCAYPTDASTGSWTSESVSITGCTFSFSFGDTIFIETGNGADIAGRGVGGSITAGSASGNMTHTATVPATNTNVAGPELFVRVREFSGTNVNAENAILTTTAQQPNPSIQTNSEGSVVTLTGNDATANVQPNSESAVLSLVANDISSNISTNIEHSVLTTTAHDAFASISVFAECANISLVSNDATIETAGGTDAQAESATLSLVAENISSNIETNIEHSIITLAGNDASINTGLSPSESILGLVAENPSVSVDVFAECATISIVANNSGSGIDTSAESATLLLVSEQSSVITGSFTNCMAECANITVTAGDLDVSVSQNALAECATLVMTTNDPFSAVSVQAQGAQIIVSGEAPDIESEVSAPSGSAPISMVGLDATIVTTSNVFAECATITIAAGDVVPTTVLPEPDLIVIKKPTLLNVGKSPNSVIVSKVTKEVIFNSSENNIVVKYKRNFISPGG